MTAAILAASQGEEGKADVFLRGRFFGSFGSLFNDERHCSPTCFSLSRNPNSRSANVGSGRKGAHVLDGEPNWKRAARKKRERG